MRMVHGREPNTETRDLKTFLQTHLRLARASNLPTAWSNVLCAFLLAGGAAGVAWGAFSGAMVAVSLLYIGGMYLNDWKDAEWDRVHRPERPIPRGEISRQGVLLWVVVYFTVALGISLITRPESLPWVLGLMACITVYDLHHKENALSPWVMAGSRALIFPWAASVSGPSFSPEVWIACGAVYFYTLGLTYVARGGIKRMVPVTLLCTCVFVPAVVWSVRLGDQSLWLTVPALVGFLGWTGYSLRGWFQEPPRMGWTVGKLIAGFVLVDLLAVSVAVPVSVFVPLCFIVLFIATIKIQTIIAGT